MEHKHRANGFTVVSCERRQKLNERRGEKREKREKRWRGLKESKTALPWRLFIQGKSLFPDLCQPSDSIPFI